MDSPTGRLFLIEPDAQVLAHLVEHLGEGVEGESYGSLDEYLDDAAWEQSPLVVFGPTFANAKGLGAIEDLLHERPQSEVILTAAKLSTTLLQQALRIGVRDVVKVEPGKGDDVSHAVSQLGEAIQRVVGVPDLGEEDLEDDDELVAADEDLEEEDLEELEEEDLEEEDDELGEEDDEAVEAEYELGEDAFELEEDPVEALRVREPVREFASDPVKELPEPVRPRVSGRHSDSRVITVMSTKGGSGKSVIATNLAVLLAQRTSDPVVLLDANLQFGDVAVLLRIAPEHTVLDATQNIHQLDEGMLRGQLQRHGPSGLWVLPAPVEPAQADDITPADLIKVIEVLRGFCAYVVIDTPGYFNDVVLSVLENSDEILFVSGLDIPNIKNVKLGLQVLHHLSLKARIRLILNRANSKVKLDVGEVLRTLQLQATALIPSEIAVPQSVNKGIPVVLDAPKSGASKAFRALADLFINDPAAAVPPSPRGRGIRGRIER